MIVFATVPLGAQIALTMLAIPFIIMSLLAGYLVTKTNRAKKPQSKKIVAIFIGSTFLWLVLMSGAFFGL